MKKYQISEDALRDAVTSATKKLMRGQRGWKKDDSLVMLEYSIEHGIKEQLYERHSNTIEIIHGVHFD